MWLSECDNNTLCGILWDYLGEQQELDETLKPADAIIVGGGRDLHVPAEAARLFKAGWAQVMVVSGGLHRGAGFIEAHKFAEIAIGLGVPDEAIIRDPEARNTGANVKNSQRHLREERGIEPRRLLAVHTPIMTRRFRATIEAQWEGELDACITRHEAVDFAAYVKRDDMNDTIPRMLGYVARMEEHFQNGFQSRQPVPDEVYAASELLVARGFEPRGLHN